MSDTSRRSSQFNNILIIILSVVVVVSAAAGIIYNITGSGEEKTAEQSVSDMPAVVEENPNDLEYNKYPEINELIDTYRRAFLEGDVSLLQQVYNTDEPVNPDILTGTSQIILAYDNTQYYTKRGLNSGEYVVFVYDELELAGISTPAPNLSVFYVKSSDDSYYIYRGVYSQSSGTYVYEDDIQDYINAIYKDDDVAELISTVNTRLDSACAMDEDLMAFMENIRSRTGTGTGSFSDSDDEDDSAGDDDE